jgi:uncharacterized protein
MRLVYDTNVLVAIFARRGEIIKFKRSVSSGQITLIISNEILDELERVLYRSFGFSRQKAKATTRLVANIAEVVQVSAIEPVSRDPKDDHVLAAALAGKADRILTYDIDLLILKKYNDIPILKPDEV